MTRPPPLPPLLVELVAPDPAWAHAAEREASRLRVALGATLLVVHHVGSTAVPSIRAKPIVDLLPVVKSLAELDASKTALERLGYLWRGEDGIAGRRYCVLLDPTTPGRRIAQLHCFEEGSAEIGRHLSFRDYLRAHPDEARAYEAVKLRAQALHPSSVLEYNAAKSDWILACQRRAAAWSA